MEARDTWGDSYENSDRPDCGNSRRVDRSRRGYSASPDTDVSVRNSSDSGSWFGCSRQLCDEDWCRAGVLAPGQCQLAIGCGSDLGECAGSIPGCDVSDSPARES